MSAFARLAMITRTPAASPGSMPDNPPMSEMERTALDAALRAAPPRPAPMYRFAAQTDAGALAGWRARIRAMLAL